MFCAKESQHSRGWQVAERLAGLESWVERMQGEVCGLAAEQDSVRQALAASGDTLMLEWSKKVQSQLKYIHKALEELNRLLKNP